MCGQCLQEARYLTRDAVRSSKETLEISSMDSEKWNKTQIIWTTFHSFVNVSSLDPIFESNQSFADLYSLSQYLVSRLLRFIQYSLSHHYESSVSVKMKFGRVKALECLSQKHKIIKPICIYVSSESLPIVKYLQVLRALQRIDQYDIWVIDSVLLNDSSSPSYNSGGAIDLLKLPSQMIAESTILRVCLESFITHLALAYPTLDIGYCNIDPSASTLPSKNSSTKCGLWLLSSSSFGSAVFSLTRHIFKCAVLLQESSSDDKYPIPTTSTPTTEITSSSQNKNLVLWITKSLWTLAERARDVYWKLVPPLSVYSARTTKTVLSNNTKPVASLTFSNDNNDTTPTTLYVDIDATNGLSDIVLRKIVHFLDGSESDDTVALYDGDSSVADVIEFDSYVECKPCWQPLPRRIRKKNSI